MVQAVPALRALAGRGRVTFCGQPRLAGLFAGAGVAAEAVSFDGFGLEILFTAEPVPAALAERLAAFDEIVSWFGSRDERYPGRLRALVPRCVVAPPVSGDARPVWQYLLATIGHADAPSFCAPLVLPEGWRRQARGALADLGLTGGRALLVVHPGAGGSAKVVPPEVLAEAVARVPRGAVEVLVHEGPADHDAVDRFARLVDPPARRLAEPSLPLLAGVLSLAAAYLGGDSGVSHLAAAVGAPATILFPAATRERWTPWSPTARSIPVDGEARAVAERAAHVLRHATSGEQRGFSPRY